MAATFKRGGGSKKIKINKLNNMIKTNKKSNIIKIDEMNNMTRINNLNVKSIREIRGSDNDTYKAHNQPTLKNLRQNQKHRSYR